MIGLFDSGVGGLSVWRELVCAYPLTSTLYVADQAHIPYGPRPIERVREYSVQITRFLLSRGAGVVVVACNSASGAALHHLRGMFPDVPFVGMEPAVKPAARGTRTGGVGVLATPVTFQGDLFASLVERYAADVRLTRQVCPGLVEQVEAGRLDTSDTVAMLRGYIEPMLADGVDTLVLGCTHYSFLGPAIAHVAGEAVRIVDPAPAVAAQAHRLELALGGVVTTPAVHRAWTTGDPGTLERLYGALGLPPVRGVEQLVWLSDGSLLPPPDARYKSP